MNQTGKRKEKEKEKKEKEKKEKELGFIWGLPRDAIDGTHCQNKDSETNIDAVNGWND